MKHQPELFIQSWTKGFLTALVLTGGIHTCISSETQKEQALYATAADKFHQAQLSFIDSF